MLVYSLCLLLLKKDKNQKMVVVEMLKHVVK